jgi:hypothetical protein
VKSPVGIKIDLDVDKRFEGVFHHMFQECRQNPHFARRISISVSDQKRSRFLRRDDRISHESKSGMQWATNNSNIPHIICRLILETCGSAHLLTDTQRIIRQQLLCEIMAV